MLFKQLNVMKQERIMNEAFDETFNQWWDCDYQTKKDLFNKLKTSNATIEEAKQAFKKYFEELKEER